MWQFFAMVEDPGDGKGLSSDEADELWEWMKAKDGN